MTQSPAFVPTFCEIFVSYKVCNENAVAQSDVTLCHRFFKTSLFVR